jgi:adenylate cyclase
MTDGQRRLAAILSADVVGYSRLMEADEVGTLAVMQAHRRELWTPKLAEFGGRVVGTAGDSVLVEFTSSVSAVLSAIAIQRGMAERNDGLPNERRMVIRIGVNIGEVIAEGEDIFGDGVNIAARLQALAEPGGIAISDNVEQQIRGKLDHAFKDGGEQQLKNIARPVRIWHWRAEQSAARSPQVSSDAAPALPNKPSIAVLPFNNMSNDPSQDYFSDGITEDIITALSKFRWFFVIARNSTFAYKGQSPDIRRVASELGVRYVLEGSVRKAGDRVRVTGQLIEAQSGMHIWAERYDRKLDDIFELQDEITTAIVGAVEPELAGVERKRASEKAPGSLHAWDLYHQGMWYIWQYGMKHNEQAIALFERSIESDPKFSAAHASLALAHALKVIYGWAEPAEALVAADRAARTAISLDDQDALGHTVLTRVLTFQGKLDSAIDEGERAVELNPNLALARYFLGFAFLWTGRDGDALTSFAEAIRLSPKDPYRWAFDMLSGLSLIRLGRCEEAVVWTRKATHYPGAPFWTEVHHAIALFKLNRVDEAKAALDRACTARPGLSCAIVERMVQGVKDKSIWLDNLRALGLPEN